MGAALKFRLLVAETEVLLEEVLSLTESGFISYKKIPKIKIHKGGKEVKNCVQNNILFFF